MSSVEEIDAQNDQAETTSIKDDTHSVKSFGTQSTGGSGYSTEDEVSQDESEPTKPEDILYGRDVRSAAISNLILFSILLFTLPFAVMYFAYRYFTDHLHLPPESASLYAGLLAVFVVIFLVAIFAYIAYREEHVLAHRVDQLLDKEKKS